jgi:hypothetical protein
VAPLASSRRHERDPVAVDQFVDVPEVLERGGGEPEQPRDDVTALVRPVHDGAVEHDAVGEQLAHRVEVARLDRPAE